MRSLGHQTANLGSSDGTFQPLPKVCVCMCKSVRVCVCVYLLTRHQDRLRGAIKTAKVGSSMDTLGCGRKVPSELPPGGSSDGTP